MTRGRCAPLLGDLSLAEAARCTPPAPGEPISPPRNILAEGDPPPPILPSPISLPVSCAKEPWRLCEDEVGISSGEVDKRDGDMGKEGRR